ncbi:MAG: glycosyltransferase family 39 protein [Patescibacteria group bacterium]
MRSLTKTLILVILTQLTLILYTNRALFFSKFDAVYWKDKYEHSQWKLPLSVRTLGDDGLYLYEGWRLIHGEDPTTLNAEVPPLGKYLIGATLLSFGNGHWYGFFTTLLAVASLGLLAAALFKNTAWALVAAALFLLDPLLANQFTLTMLDSLQLLFAILCFWALHRIMTHPRPGWERLVFLGVTFGLFAATKAPIFSPFLGLVVTGFLWLKTRRPIFILIFAGSAALTYLIPYLPYFLLGHSLREWLGVQKWIWEFYRHVSVAPNWGSAITTLLFNRYQNLFSGAWETAAEWSVIWPAIAIMSLTGLVSYRRQSKNLTGLAIASFSILALVFLSVIPFWTRYLLMIVPFLYLGATFWLRRLSPALASLIISLLLVLNFLSSIPILFPTPEASVKQFIYDWRYGFFRDMYEQLTRGTRAKMDRQSFHRFGLKTFNEAQIEAVAIDLVAPRFGRWANQQVIKLRITYFTRDLGPFSEEKELTVIKEDGRWRIPWQWDYLIGGLSPETHLETTLIPAKRGAVIASDKIRLAEDVPSVLIWVTPGEIDKSREEAMFKKIEGLFEGKVAAIALHQRTVGNTLADLPMPLGVVPFSPDPKLLQELKSFPGIKLTPKATRIYRPSTTIDVGRMANSQYFECCSLLYSTTTYDGTRGMEKEKNDLLKGYYGGTLVIKDQRGNVIRTIFDLPKQDGRDVQL